MQCGARAFIAWEMSGGIYATTASPAGEFRSSTTPNTPTPALHDDGNGSQQVPSEPGTADGGVRPNRAHIRLNTLTDMATWQPALATGVPLKSPPPDRLEIAGL
jgi:hypothetical protein